MTIMTKSIRWRFMIWLAILLTAILTGFGVTAYQLVRTHRLNQVDQELERRVAAVSADARGPGGPPGPRGSPGPNVPEDNIGVPPRRPPNDSPVNRDRFVDPGGRNIHLSTRTLALLDELGVGSCYYAFWSRDRDLMISSTNAPPDLRCPPKTAVAAAMETRTRGNLREVFVFTELWECALVGRDMSPDFAAMRRFGLWLAAAGIAVLGVGLSGGWIIAGRALRPIEKISAAANRI